MWTRWRCRRCYHDIPTGLRGKYRQAIAARTGEWSTGASTSSVEEDRKSKSLEAEHKELWARIEALEKKGGEGAQGGQGLPSRRESGIEEEWNGHGRGRRSRAAKSWTSEGESCRRELQDIEKLSCMSKEVQESLKSNLQQQLQEVEQRRHALMPEHQKVQKRSQKIQSIQDKRRNMQEESAAAREEMRKIRGNISQ